MFSFSFFLRCVYTNFFTVYNVCRYICTVFDSIDKIVCGFFLENRAVKLNEPKREKKGRKVYPNAIKKHIETLLCDKISLSLFFIDMKLIFSMKSASIMYTNTDKRAQIMVSQKVNYLTAKCVFLEIHFIPIELDMFWVLSLERCSQFARTHRIKSRTSIPSTTQPNAIEFYLRQIKIQIRTYAYNIYYSSSSSSSSP